MTGKNVIKYKRVINGIKLIRRLTYFMLKKERTNPEKNRNPSFSPKRDFSFSPLLSKFNYSIQPMLKKEA